MNVESKHREVSRQLLSEIAAGKYGASGRLPGEEQLVKKFGVSRTTVGRALRDLQTEGVIEQRAATEKLELTQLNLILAQPVIPRENILLIEAIHDLCVPKEDIEELWQAWGRPEIWRLPYGHITGASAQGLTGRVLHWLAPRLNATASRTGQSIVQRITNA